MLAQARQVLEREEEEEEGGWQASEEGPGGLAEIEGALRRKMAGTLEAAAQVTRWEGMLALFWCFPSAVPRGVALLGGSSGVTLR